MSLSFRPRNWRGFSKRRTFCAPREMRGGCWARFAARRREERRPNPLIACEKSSVLAGKANREAAFHVEFREDLRYRVETDRNTALRVLQLIEAVIRDPFAGPGKPEPLKYLFAGCWSARHTQPVNRGCSRLANFAVLAHPMAEFRKAVDVEARVVAR